MIEKKEKELTLKELASKSRETDVIIPSANWK